MKKGTSKYQKEYEEALLNPPLCACGEKIVVELKHRYFGVPKSHRGHNNIGKIAWNKGISSPRKDKTYEEIYGDVRANDIKSKISKTNTGQISDRKDKTYEEYYGVEKAKELKEQKSKIFSGRTQPEYLKKIWSDLAIGRIISESTRHKISKGNKGKNKQRTGKTYEEIFGDEKALELRLKRGISASVQKSKVRDTEIELILINAIREFNIVETHVALYGCPDGFIYPNICIFADGDYWHANPNKYKADYFNKSIKRTAQQIWDKDKKVSDSLIKDGYTVLRFWEHEIHNNLEDCIKRIKEKINEIRISK